MPFNPTVQGLGYVLLWLSYASVLPMMMPVRNQLLVIFSSSFHLSTGNLLVTMAKHLAKPRPDGMTAHLMSMRHLVLMSWDWWLSAESRTMFVLLASPMFLDKLDSLATEQQWEHL